MMNTLTKTILAGGAMVASLSVSATTLAAAPAGALVFTSPPRETGGAESDVYEPLAEYLTAKTGKKFVYEYPDNMLTYQTHMRAGKYDLVFDGPHFISWRMVKSQHEPIVKLPGKLSFSVVVKADNDKVTDIKQLAGRMVCGIAPPNLATLTMYGQFENPARQPLVVEVKSFKEAYENVVTGKCAGAVIRDQALKNLDKEKKLKTIYQSEGVANQGFSAGPRITPELRQKVTEALLAPEAKDKLKEFFARYNKDKELLKAKREEFEGLAVLLKDVWGFSIDEQQKVANGKR